MSLWVWLLSHLVLEDAKFKIFGGGRQAGDPRESWKKSADIIPLQRKLLFFLKALD